MRYRCGPRHCDRNESGNRPLLRGRSGKASRVDSLHCVGAGSQETCRPTKSSSGPPGCEDDERDHRAKPVRLPDLDQPWHRLPAIVGVSACHLVRRPARLRFVAGARCDSASFSGSYRSAPDRSAGKWIEGWRWRQSRRRHVSPAPKIAKAIPVAKRSQRRRMSRDRILSERRPMTFCARMNWRRLSLLLHLRRLTTRN